MTDVSADSLRKFHTTEGADVSVVILPHAGGAASYYYSLSEALSKHFQVFAVQYPGRHDRRRESMPRELQTLARDIHAEIEQRAPGQVVLLGHSMGSVLAYEIASRWSDSESARLLGLFVSARVAPSVEWKIPDVRSANAAIAEMKALGGTDMRVLADSEFLTAALDVMRMDYRLLADYQRDLDAVTDHAIDYPIYALAPDSDERAPVAAMARWAQHTSRFDLRTFAGGHFYINDRIDEVVDYLRTSILSEVSSIGTQP
ncbi:alpha/beta fold hydrolase [Nocardia sp. NPDC046473]|uniref:thioesterase II family protein n=1 Tax=Nocardia sp. NPDC046473 TaxID=3155733 RepID=UPI0033F994A3